ncbi:alpha/beta hydrolase [Helicobacter brantae]|uniref:Alpha/beta hydrolase n=1 Tax=Helicobacter brantae TaxID=375927 RepID=A0A3D8J3V3_9HELI|nr:alpha/beta hydrolase [Helicobacter brantae]RDU72103.1 alpha/beta hydrolase [Helicobacter brantae]
MRILMCALLCLASVFAKEGGDKLGYAKGAEVVKVEIKNPVIIDSISGVIFSQIKDTRSVRGLRMSLLIPRTNELKPCVVYVPGGGFSSADYEKFSEMRYALAKAGFVVAAVEYRVVPNKFPALVVDAKSAIRYLREHYKEYGINPKAIGILGDSAGGYLSQMVAMSAGEYNQGDYLNQSSEVQSAVSMYGISNLLNIGEGFPPEIQKVHASPAVTEALLVNGVAFRDFAGASIDSDPTKALKASPMGHLEGKKPPLLLMHGDKDTLVSPAQSSQMYEALKKRGQKVEYIIVEGAGHGDITWFQEPIINRVVEWFKQTLPKPIPDKEISQDKNANL